MHGHQQRDDIFNLNLESAWRDQVRTAATQPWLAAALLERGPGIARAFVQHYERLSRLPRSVRRALGRKLGMSLAGVAFMFAFGNESAFANTINVGGNCTLTEAILNANDTTSGNAGNSCAAGNPQGADTITVTAAQSLGQSYTTAYDGQSVGLPLITSEVTIDGTSAASGNVTIERQSDASDDFRIFSVSPGGSLTLKGITVSGGRIVPSETVTGFRGAGISSYGNLTLDSSTISGNTVDGTAGACAGLIHQNAVLTLSDSAISGNAANSIGGFCVVYQEDTYTYGGSNATYPTANITNSTVSGNAGGGFALSDGTASFTNSTVSGNTGIAAIVVEAGNLTTVNLTRSTVSGNTGVVGGIYATQGTQNITNSTISGNTGQLVGGLYIGGGEVNITNSTVSGNTGEYGGMYIFGAPVNLRTTLVSGNTGTKQQGTEIKVRPNAGGPGGVTSSGDNLFGHSGVTTAEALNGFSPAATDITATSDGTEPTQLSDILDTALQDNGGPTLTHALVATSPALNQIENDPLTTDQRGVSRPQPAGGGSDIGSFEKIAAAGSGTTTTAAALTLSAQLAQVDGAVSGETIELEPLNGKVRRIGKEVKGKVKLKGSISAQGVDVSKVRKILLEGLLEDFGARDEYFRGEGEAHFLPVLLEPEDGNKANKGVFVTPEGETPQIRMKLKTKSGGGYTIKLRAKKGTVLEPACTSDGVIDLHAALLMEMEEGFLLPVAEEAEWRCKGGDSVRKLKLAK